MPLHKPSLQLSLVSAIALGLFTMHASGQNGSAAAERCASFNALSERHGDSAREILAKAQEQAKSMPTADAEKFLAANKAGADSEWEMSALARDAYRKCMQDYLSGGTAAAPQAPAPVQQQTVQQPAKQQAKSKPVQQAQPAKKTKPVQQQAQQKPRVQQQQSNQPVERPEQPYQPILPGILGFGLGIFR